MDSPATHLLLPSSSLQKGQSEQECMIHSDIYKAHNLHVQHTSPWQGMVHKTINAPGCLLLLMSLLVERAIIVKEHAGGTAAIVSDQTQIGHFNLVTESWLGMRYPCTLKTTVYVTHSRHFQILTFSFLLPLLCGKSDKHMYTKAHNRFSAPH